MIDGRGQRFLIEVIWSALPDSAVTGLYITQGKLSGPGPAAGFRPRSVTVPHVEHTNSTSVATDISSDNYYYVARFT